MKRLNLAYFSLVNRFFKKEDIYLIDRKIYCNKDIISNSSAQAYIHS